MKINVLSENLTIALATLKKSMPAGNVKEHHAVLIPAYGERIKLIAYDGEQFTTVPIGGEIITSGEVLLPIDPLLPYCQLYAYGEFKGERVTLEYQSDSYQWQHDRFIVSPAAQVHLYGAKGNDKARFAPILDAELSIPAFDNWTPIATFTDSSAFLATWERAVMFSAKSYSRPVLQGIQALFVNDTLTVASADGYALYKKTIPASVTGQGAKLIIPNHKLFKTLPKNEALTFALCGDYLRITTNAGTNYIIRLIDGTFPDYEMIIPKNHPYSIAPHHDLKTFTKALKQIKTYAKDSAKCMKITITPSNQGIPNYAHVALSARSQERGDNEAIFDAHCPIQHIPLTLNVNIDYLYQAVNKAKSFSLRYKDASSPVAITTDSDELIVIMPMEDQSKDYSQPAPTQAESYAAMPHCDLCHQIADLEFHNGVNICHKCEHEINYALMLADDHHKASMAELIEVLPLSESDQTVSDLLDTITDQAMEYYTKEKKPVSKLKEYTAIALIVIMLNFGG